MLTGPVRAQTRQALGNLRAVLDAAGLRIADVIKVTVYVSDITHWQEVDEVYADFFGGHRPARTVVPAVTLHYGVAIEVDAIARMPDR